MIRLSENWHRSLTAARPVAHSGPTGQLDAPDVDLGVIYTHERQFIPRLLSTMSQSCGNRSARLILVDNHSADGTDDWEKYFACTHVLRNERRLPYGANLNRILEASTAPFVLLLNTDMYFDPAAQCVSRMVQFMQQHPDCGIAGCRLYRVDGSFAYPARRRPSLSAILARRCGLSRWFGRSEAEYLYAERNSTETFDCEWLSGCFLMIRREAFQQVGFFDTSFVKYFEDVDMCLRMARAGWRVMFHGGTYCYHMEQRASRRLMSRDAWRHGLSYLRWLGKWGPSPRWEAVAGIHSGPPSRRQAA